MRRLAALRCTSSCSLSEAAFQLSPCSTYKDEVVYNSSREENPRLNSISTAPSLANLKFLEIVLLRLCNGLLSGRKSATTQFAYLALKKPALALGTRPAYTSDDFPSPEAPVTIRN